MWTSPLQPIWRSALQLSAFVSNLFKACSTRHGESVHFKRTATFFFRDMTSGIARSRTLERST